MESTTYLKNIRISPKKLRFLLPSIKKIEPMDAVSVLSLMPKRSAKILSKALRSAISNAKHTLKVNEDLLEFKALSVDAGQTLKRYNPGSRGGVLPYKKRFSHIKVVLRAKSPKGSLPPSKKEAEKVREENVEEKIVAKKKLKVTKAPKRAVKK